MEQLSESSSNVIITPEEFARNMGDPMWRLSHLYKIIVKSKEGGEGLVVQFKPNRAQLLFLDNLHYRNIILKARQLGFSTLICIAWLDHALFNANSRCGIIAQDREAASVLFRDKVKFAYDNLPDVLRQAMPLSANNASELLFAHNNSSIRVATSMRSGTLHRLHVSEFGKICAKYPEKAREVVTGSIPAVPLDGIAIIESTAEGADGRFYDMTQKAIAMKEQEKVLSELDWRFHFFPWWQEPSYRLSPEDVVITSKDNEMFDKVEAEMHTEIDAEQRAWYVTTRDSVFYGNEMDMLREYPGTPAEAFSVSSEGCYYTAQLSAARKQGRVLRIPLLNTPVNTFWDIGNADGTAIWFHQKVGMEDRFIGYYEAHGEDLTHYVRHLQNTGYLFNKHFLPHDAAHSPLSKNNANKKTMLQELGLRNIEIVPVTPSKNFGIQQTRQVFPGCYFDEVGCKQGLERLAAYKKRWNEAAGRWSDEPFHDVNSEAADAFRQFAQAKLAGMITMVGSAPQRVLTAPSFSNNGMGILG